MKSISYISIKDCYIDKFINTNYSEEQQEEEEEDNEDSDEDDHPDVVEVQPVPANEASAIQLSNLSEKVINSSLFQYIVDKSKAPHILKWLHTNMDPIDSKSSKEKLIYLRALCEAGYFTKLIPRKDYIKEFGNISKSNYNTGMGKKVKYDRGAIDNIVEHLPF